jgi:hypothetical protein
VAEVVAAEVRHAGTLERGHPDAAAPVLAAEVAAGGIGEDERVAARPALGEVELCELARDGREQLGFAGALRLGRRHCLAGDGAVDAQALAWLPAVIEHVVQTSAYASPGRRPS